MYNSRMNSFSSDFQAWLDNYLNFEKLPQKNIFWLDTMQFFCEQFGHPECFAPSFHVAGSKGKGSVSAMIASILDEAGIKTGLYSSPHIIDFLERVQSARGFFSESVYESAAQELMQGVAKIKPEQLPAERPITWFELVTLFSFLVFRKACVGCSVFEVGLGGRLDATNVITPKICCITPIELEHTEFLGDTLEKIAFEKGGIIKENVPVVIAGQKDSVKDVFRKIATEKNAPIYFLDETVKNLSFSYDESGSFMNISFEAPVFSRIVKTRLRLLGEFQAQNAALAALAVKIAMPQISEETIEKGLSRAMLPGRFEITKSKRYKNIPALVLDGAHTVNSARFTAQTFSTLFKGFGEPVLLFGCAADKDAADIAPLFKDFGEVLITKPGEVKKADIEAMKRAFSDAGIAFTASEDFKVQIRNALEIADKKSQPLLVTGSFYLVSEVKKILLADENPLNSL